MVFGGLGVVREDWGEASPCCLGGVPAHCPGSRPPSTARPWTAVLRGLGLVVVVSNRENCLHVVWGGGGVGVLVGGWVCCFLVLFLPRCIVWSPPAV